MHLYCSKTFHLWEWGLLLICSWCCVITCSMGFPFNVPLVGDKLPEIDEDKPGCHMDGLHYAFGEMWSPVFIPQGVMVCVRCQCLPVDKKGVIQARGRTMCRNIKDLCPVPKCTNPTLRPGKCCKACEGDDFEDKFSFQPGVDVFVNNAYSRDAASTDPEAKDFEALLVGHHVPAGPISTRAIAMVHLTIDGPTSVHYTVRYSNLDRPKYLRILHVNGNVLYKTPIVKQMTGDKKACGEWKNPLPVYLDYIREGNLLAVISTSRHPDGIVAGRIKVAPEKSKEIFSSLLIDKTFRGGGALASIAYSPKSKTVVYNIVTDDVVKKGRRGIFTVSIMKDSKVIYKTKGTALAKTTKLSGKWRVYKRSHRRQLARGLLRIRVKFSDGHVLIGNIQTKLTCDDFQAVLSGSQTPGKRKTMSAGSVVMQLGDNGKIHYSVRLANMVDKVSKIRLEGYRRKKRGKMRTYGSLTSSFVTDSNNTFSGWANGTLKKLDAEAIHGLLNNRLYVSVTVTRRGRREIRGRLVVDEHNKQHALQESPTVLVPTTRRARGGAGHVWLSMDSKCRLHFDAMYTHPVESSSKSFEVFLGDDDKYSGEDMIWLPFKMFPVRRFGYIYAKGEVSGLSEDVLRSLDRGRMFLQMSTLKNSQEMYRANITIPNTCWKFSNDGDGLLGEDNSLPGGETITKMCRFEDQVYPEGTAWIPDVDQACTTCSCVRGETLCQRMTCPTLSCSNPVQLDGRCCPSCPHEDPTEMCQLGEDPRHYPLHSVWHPYLPTDGFSSCALCTCLPGKKVKCYKQPCPVPDCPKSDWIKDENNTCCYKCKETVQLPVPTEEVITQPQRDINMDGACMVNGEFHHNGERWHPTIHPFGYMRCFYCVCQNGTFTCGRVQCPVLRCANRIKRPNVCCEECADDQGEMQAIEEIDHRHKTAPPNPKAGCQVADKWYTEGQRWKPNHPNDTDAHSCIVCKCTAGEIQCRPRCPKGCRKDPFKSPCCQHCSDKKYPAKVKKIDDEKLPQSSTVKRKQRRKFKRQHRTAQNKATKKKQTLSNNNDEKLNLISFLKHK